MNTNPAMRPIEILLVEDSPTDILLAREALEYSKLLNNLHVVTDGVQAMAFLRREGEYSHALRPDLVLLDLNLPRKDGREVLAEIKSDESLKFIPVVILTTSQDEKDVVAAYGSYANCYISKPVDFNQFVEVIKSIENFWLMVVTLPGGSS
jgi:two-component system response regulator